MVLYQFHRCNYGLAFLLLAVNEALILPVVTRFNSIKSYNWWLIFPALNLFPHPNLPLPTIKTCYACHHRDLFFFNFSMVKSHPTLLHDFQSSYKIFEIFQLRIVSSLWSFYFTPVLNKILQEYGCCFLLS